MKLLLVAVSASRVLPNVPNMRLESRDGRQIKNVEDIHSALMSVDSLGRLSERARHDPAWQVLAQLDGKDWQPNASDPTDPLAAAEKIQAAARAAAHVGPSDAYKAMLSDGGNATSTTVEPAPAAEGNVSAPFAPSVDNFLFGNTTPAPAVEAKAPEKADEAPKFVVPPLLGAQAEVTQAEASKASEARKAADAVEAAATAEQTRAEAEEKAKVEQAKAAEEKKKADEVATKAAAEANASAPMATTMAAFSGDLNSTITTVFSNQTDAAVHSVVELHSAHIALPPSSFVSIRRARPEENVHPWEIVQHPKPYERKRSMLWTALSFGGGISPHHDMPVSRSLSLIEFVHTTHSHTMLMAVVPGLVLFLVCAALVLEGVGLSGMLKGPA